MRCSIIKNLVVVFLICTQASVAAANGFFHQRYRGWLWFEQQEQQKINEEIQQELEQKAKEEQERAIAKAEVEAFSKELDDLKYMMIRYPENLDHVYAYKKRFCRICAPWVVFSLKSRIIDIMLPLAFENSRK